MKKKYIYHLEAVLVVFSSILILVGLGGIVSNFVNDLNNLLPLIFLFPGIALLLLAQKIYKKDPKLLDIPLLRISLSIGIIFGLLMISIFIIEAIDFESIDSNFDFFLMLIFLIIIIIIYFSYIDKKIENSLLKFNTKRKKNKK